MIAWIEYNVGYTTNSFQESSRIVISVVSTVILFPKITVKRETSKGGRIIKDRRAKKSTTEIRPGVRRRRDTKNTFELPRSHFKFTLETSIADLPLKKDLSLK